MTLDDQLNPNDGSFIDIVDGALFEFNKKIAEKWQDKTYRGKKDLEKVLYLGSFAALSNYTINNFEFFGVATATIAIAAGLKGCIENIRPKNGLEEQIFYESIGFPKKTMKYLNSLIYGSGIFLTSISMGNILIGSIMDNYELYRDSINHLTLGLGTLGFVSADYIAKSDIGDPPKKPKKKSVYEKVKEGIGSLIPKKVYG